MTDETKRKEFDCVKAMREIRDRISSEIAGKTYDELAHWLREHHYSDPVLQRFVRRIDKNVQSTDEEMSGSVNL